MILNRENTIDSLKNNRIEERNGIKFQEFQDILRKFSKCSEFGGDFPDNS